MVLKRVKTDDQLKFLEIIFLLILKMAKCEKVTKSLVQRILI